MIKLEITNLTQIQAYSIIKTRQITPNKTKHKQKTINFGGKGIHVTMTRYITNLHQTENAITQNNVYEDRF